MYSINGVKRSKAETFEKETELSEGKRLSESFLTNTKNYIQNDLKKDVNILKNLNVKYLFHPKYNDIFSFKTKNKSKPNSFKKTNIPSKIIPFNSLTTKITSPLNTPKTKTIT